MLQIGWRLSSPGRVDDMMKLLGGVQAAVDFTDSE
jgi:hypothetical protein